MTEVWLVLKWLFVLAVLTAVGAPIAAAVLARLPRRGAPFALPAAMIPLAVLVFWIGQVTFGVHTVAAALVLVGIGSAAAYYRGHRPNWRAVAGGYAVFALGFLFLTAFRAYNAGVTPAGGEQFLHFGLVKALLRAPHLPPEDFWFAGEPLRYYYGTQLQVTALTILTDTPARYGFNLGIATFYGLLFVSAYGLVGSLTDLRGRSYRLGGALGAFFVGIAGATTTAIRLAFGLLPRDLALQYGGPAFGAVRHMPYPEAVAELSRPSSWGWFFTRYVVPGTLQEFPLYSFVKADLHGHSFANGYVVVAAGLALAYYLTPGEQRWRRLGIVYGGMGVIAGVFGFMNTWSLPTVVGLAWLAMAAADPHPATLLPRDLGRPFVWEPAGAGRDAASGSLRDPAALARRLGAEGWRVVVAAVLAVPVALIGVAIASPFLIFGHVPTNDGIGFLPPRTSLAPFLVIYGGLLALFAGFLAYRGWPAVRDRPRAALAAGSVAALAVAAALVTVLEFPVLAVTGPILLAAWWLVRTDRIGFEGVVLVAGVGLILSMELVHAKVWPPTQIRWNTALKVAVQGWTLSGAAAGAVSALLLGAAKDALAGNRAVREHASRFASRLPRRGEARGAGEGSGEATETDGNGRAAPSLVPAVLVGALAVAVILTSAPFAAMTFSGAVLDDVREGEEGTLDGLATHDHWRSDEMQAIYWLDDRNGTPTIVEAPGRATYRWTNPASTLTGVPTVIGWDHQQGYRGVEAFERRAERVDEIYSGRWPRAETLLQGYGVEYVYVGPNEREEYGGRLRDFEGRSAFSVAFENNVTTIYAVNQTALSAVDDE